MSLLTWSENWAGDWEGDWGNSHNVAYDVQNYPGTPKTSIAPHDSSFHANYTAPLVAKPSPPTYIHRHFSGCNARRSTGASQRSVTESFVRKKLNCLRSAMSQAAGVLTNVARLAITLGLGGSVLNASLFTVDGGHRAVIFDRFRGVLDVTAGEGTHFIIPWVQTPYIFDVRTRPRSITSVTGTKDLQMVNLTLRVLSKPDAETLPTIFKTLGLDYDERVLPSIGNEVLKAVVAQFNADQLLTERPYVSKMVRDALTSRAKDFNLVLDDVALTHLSYGSEFSRAVEQKQVAQQEAERSKFVVMKAEQERRAAIVRAEGESEAARLISEATSTVGNALIELRRIEAAREIAGTLAKSRNVVYLPSGNNMLLGLNPGMGGGS